jgi:site-specific DNA-methyltransferase (adenine-specific)
MKLINSDCIATMKAMPDNFIDSIVTDPPYELGFMGKSWDSSGIAFNVEVWTEALRVLKPGGHLIAFSGSRTYHRMAVAIEDAGFEIRDQIMWVYGSGFPKSMDISKAIDKASGFVGDVIGTEKVDIGMQGGSMHAGRSRNVIEREITSSSDEAKQWQGWGTALKPAHEPMVLARKPVIGTIANNVLTYGVGGLNIDGSRVGSEGGGNSCAGGDDCQCANNNEIFSATKHPIRVEGNQGRFPANFIHDGSDEVVELFPAVKGATSRTNASQEASNNAMFGGGFAGAVYDDGLNTSAARFFYCAKTSKRDRNEGLDEFEEVRDHDGRAEGKVGGNNPRNRTNAAKLNHHPTVKPTSLMQYLVKLVTPAGGTVLDPFMGSGSTGKACVYEGFNFIGIDQSDEYVEIARARIEFAMKDIDADI